MQLPSFWGVTNPEILKFPKAGDRPSTQVSSTWEPADGGEGSLPVRANPRQSRGMISPRTRCFNFQPIPSTTAALVPTDVAPAPHTAPRPRQDFSCSELSAVALLTRFPDAILSGRHRRMVSHGDAAAFVGAAGTHAPEAHSIDGIQPFLDHTLHTVSRIAPSDAIANKARATGFRTECGCARAAGGRPPVSSRVSAAKSTPPCCCRSTP